VEEEGEPKGRTYRLCEQTQVAGRVWNGCSVTCLCLSTCVARSLATQQLPPRHVGFSSHMGGGGPVQPYSWLFEAKFQTHVTCELLPPLLLLLLTAHPSNGTRARWRGFWGLGGGEVSTLSTSGAHQWTALSVGLYAWLCHGVGWVWVCAAAGAVGGVQVFYVPWCRATAWVALQDSARTCLGRGSRGAAAVCSQQPLPLWPPWATAAVAAGVHPTHIC
jgi:hypothetical protein